MLVMYWIPCSTGTFDIQAISSFKNIRLICFKKLSQHHALMFMFRRSHIFLVFGLYWPLNWKTLIQQQYCWWVFEKWKCLICKTVASWVILKNDCTSESLGCDWPCLWLTYLLIIFRINSLRYPYILCNAIYKSIYVSERWLFSCMLIFTFTLCRNNIMQNISAAPQIDFCVIITLLIKNIE